MVVSVISERTQPLALGVAGIFWLIRWLETGRPSVRTLADWGIVIIVIMTLLTLWVTALPEETRPQVYRLLLGVALYYAVVNWTTSVKRLRLLVMGLISGGFLLALGALVSVDWSWGGNLPFIPREVYASLSPLVSDTINPNVMAGYLVIVLPCALAIPLFAWRHLNWGERTLVGITALGMLGVLILSQSRGGLIAMVAALLGLAFLRWRWGWLLLSVSIVGGAIVIWSLGFDNVLDILAANDTFGGIENRVEIWSRALYMTQDFPFTGIGMGSFQTVTDLFYPLFLTPSGVPHAHNLFLQITVDLGLPGLIAWLAILMLIITSTWAIYRHSRSTGDGWTVSLGAGLLCSQIALLIHGLFDAVTWSLARPAVVVWGMWGLVVAVYQLQVNNQLTSQFDNGAAKEKQIS